MANAGNHPERIAQIPTSIGEITEDKVAHKTHMTSITKPICDIMPVIRAKVEAARILRIAVLAMAFWTPLCDTVQV